MSTVYRYQNIPTDSDTPDVPRDFERYADSQWNSVTGAEAHVNDSVSGLTVAATEGPPGVWTPSGSVELVGANITYPQGSLLLVSTSFDGGTIGPVLGNYWIAYNNVPVANSPNYLIDGNPSVGSGQRVSWTNQVLVMSPGPGRFQCMVQLNISGMNFRYRRINVQCLLRG